MATILSKRSTTAASVPSALINGELAFNIADDPIKGWIGTPTGNKPLFREIPIVSLTPPLNPPDNALWWDSKDGVLNIFFENQFVAATKLDDGEY